MMCNYHTESDSSGTQVTLLQIQSCEKKNSIKVKTTLSDSQASY